MELNELAKRFHVLFSGLERAHGTYNNIDNTREDGKRQGKAITKREPVTDELWLQHLGGRNGIGIIPIRDDSSVVFGAIDIDVYDGLNAPELAARIASLNLPLIPCRSKSGGLHIYCFAQQPVSAGAMVDRLRDIAAKLGHGRAELFPKQVTMLAGSNDLGSWINMPYFGGDASTRHALKPDGSPLTMQEFLLYADSLKAELDFFRGTGAQGARIGKSDMGERVLPDGPPCLQHMLENGIPEGMRNGALFNIAIYFRKSRPDDWAECVQAANDKYCQPPLGLDELKDIIGSVNAQTYAYSCSKQPLVQFCNAVKCRTRKYGISGGESAFPAIGNLRLMPIEPPVFYLDVKHPKKDENRTLELSTEELDDMRLFRRKCIANLQICPVMPTAVVWTQMIQTLLDTCTELQPPPSNTSSVEGQFWELVDEFLTETAHGQREEEILLGMPFTKNGRTYFRARDLMKFLRRIDFKEYKLQQIGKLLKMRKDPKDGEKPLAMQGQYADHEFRKIAGKGVNMWSVPAPEKRTDPFAVPDSVTNDLNSF